MAKVKSFIMAKNPKQVYGGLKGSLMRKLNDADEYTKLSNAYTGQEDEEVARMISGIEKAFDVWENKFVQELTDVLVQADVETFTTDIEAYDKECKKVIKSLRNYLQRLKNENVAQVIQNSPQDARGAPVQDKVSDTLRPEKLLRSCNLEEFYDWNEKFMAWFKDNEKTLEKKGLAFSRQLLHTVLDSRLVDDLKTNDGVKDDTTITGQGGCLEKIKDIFLREYPLHIRRYNFLKCIQDQGQPFDDWWVVKKKMARNCDLDKVNFEDMMLLGIMTGIRDPKLKEAFLRVESPTYQALAKIAENWQSADKQMKSLSSPDVEVNKLSNYRSERERSWSRDRDKSESENRGRSQRSGHKACGNSNKCKGPRSNTCPAKDHICKICNKLGHLEAVCYQKRSKTPGREGESQLSKSRTNKVHVYKMQSSSKGEAIDDNEPVPLARMAFTPLKWRNGKTEEWKNGKSFDIWVFPDQGSSQSIISFDIAKRCDLRIDYGKKKIIKDAQHNRMDCTGTTTFLAEYEGNSTEVMALVSKSITNECLLGWRALQRLKILPENFPHAIVKAVKADEDGKEETKMKTGIEPGKEIQEMVDGEYSDVFYTSGELKPMKGGTMKIHLKEGPIKPLHIYTARKIPYALQEDAKATLDEDEALGIIERVEGPTEWCLPMTFTRKPNGKVRKLLDAVKLNDWVLRTTHLFPSPKDIVSTIPCNTKYFAVFDCVHGYWQLELDEESKPLTTFLTEFGRYRYRRAPMGLVSSGDEFCARTDKALADLPGVMKLVDDILIFGSSAEEIVTRIRNVFERCKEWGITLSKKKYQFGTKVKFAGYVLGQDGVSPDPDKIAAIQNFPTPENITDVRSWFGLTEPFSQFAPDLKMAMVPLKGLLSSKNAFVWTPEHQKSMELTKKIITDPNGKVLRHFDPNLPVSLFTDASRKGIGFILTQRDKEGALRLITCSSRFLSEAEKNYAVHELECLAIVWAITKCRLYLVGTNFTVYTDHKPLIGIMNGRNLDANNNARIQRLLSKLLGYSYKVEWIAGKRQTIADALSRAPVFAPEEEENMDILVRSLSCEDKIPDLALLQLSEAASQDGLYQEVFKAVQDRKLLKNLPPGHPGWVYNNQWESLSVEEKYGLVLFHDRIVVPKAARKKLLELLHVQHTGIYKTYENARQLYFWQGMKNEIKTLVSSCEECISLLPSQPLESRISTVATRPFEAVSLDLGKQGGIWHLIQADRYSGWPNAEPLKNLDTEAVINILEEWFVDTGKPERIRTDGGPQFRDKFTQWCKAQNIIHELSSAYHHESNGHAEVTVRDMKRLLEKTKNEKEFKKALMEYRNTPRYDKLSPAQWLFGRRQRTNIPALPHAYRRLSNEEIEKFETLRREEVEARSKKDRRRMPPLQVGQLVALQDPVSGRWDSRGTVKSVRKKRRSYLIDIDGREYLRNRRFLRPCLIQELPHYIPKPPKVKPILSTSSEEAEATQDVPLRRSTRLRNKIVHFTETY